MVGCVGDDTFGEDLRTFLSDEGIDVDGVRTCHSAPTGTAVIVVDEKAENTIVVVPGANSSLIPGHIKDLDMRPGDVVVAQQEIGADVVWAVLRRARQVGATAVLNPAPALPDQIHLLDLADLIVLNESELRLLAPRGDGETWTVGGAAQQLRSRSDQIVVVTLGSAGLTVVAEASWHVPALAVDALDTTGAGDCFVGCLAARLAAADSLDAGLVYATTAASLCVQRPGAGPSMPRAAEVRALMVQPSGWTDPPTG